GNAVGIAKVVARPPCIDEQGMPLRRHEQRGLAALHVYEVDPQLALRSILRRCKKCHRRDYKADRHSTEALFHRRPPFADFQNRSTSSGCELKWPESLHDDSAAPSCLPVFVFHGYLMLCT